MRAITGFGSQSSHMTRHPLTVPRQRRREGYYWIWVPVLTHDPAPTGSGTAHLQATSRRICLLHHLPSHDQGGGVRGEGHDTAPICPITYDWVEKPRRIDHELRASRDALFATRSRPCRSTGAYTQVYTSSTFYC